MSTRDWWGMLVKTAADWNADNGPQKGAALAYYTIFSLAPLLLIAMALAGLVVGNASTHDLLMAQIRTMIGDQGALAVDDLLVNISQSGASTAASTIGVFVLLLGASGVVGELQTSLNHIWKAHPKESTLAAQIETRLLAFVFVLAVGFLLIASLIFSALVAALEKRLAALLTVPPFALQAVNLSVSFSAVTLLFAMIYKVLPETRVAWHDVWMGAVVTALLFAVGNTFLGIYLARFSGASAFGAAGSVVLILVWTYYCAQILYLGAEFTHVYAETRGSRK